MSNGSTEAPITPEYVNYTNSSEIKKKPPVSAIPRAASYNQLLPKGNIQYIPQKIDNQSRTLSDNVYAHFDGVRLGPVDDRAEHSSGSNGFLRRGSSKPKSTKVKISQFTIGPGETIDGATNELQAVEKTQATERLPDRQKLRRSISGSISKFARRSWMSASRSPSPSKSPSRTFWANNKSVETDASTGFSLHLNAHEQSVSSSGLNTFGNHIVHGTSHMDGLLRIQSRPPLSAALTEDAGDRTPSMPAIPKSFSIEKLPSLHHKESLVGAPAIPRTPSTEKLYISSTDMPRKKDELWSVFRNLEGDFHK